MNVTYLFAALDIFARGGGGGSGGGGGGSGGGGGGGILMLGYLPAYYSTQYGKRKFGIAGALGIGLPATIATAVVLALLFSSSKSGLGVVEVIAAIVGFVSGFFELHGKVMHNFKKSKEAVQTAAKLDPAWDETSLKQTVSDTFMKYQADWTALNYESVKAYATPQYAYHASLMMAALKQLGRVNNVQNPKILRLEFAAVQDHQDNTQDSFTAYIDATADDQLIDARTNSVLFRDTNSFSEYWVFKRDGTKWLLDSIKQLTADANSMSASVQAFAAQQNLFYSPDWGWLLLPKMGDIFSSGDFGKSDINNHCIGVYHNLLIQLYTYVPGKDNNGRPTGQYVVAQVAVPNKNYGRVIVRHKSSTGLFSKLTGRAPKGTERFSTESVDFNKMYDLYASNYEGTTTFELLHPIYIEKMQALPFKVELEVYENTIFIYSKDKSADYASMFELLKAAFEELKL